MKEKIVALAKLRLEQGKQCIDSAKKLVEIEDYKGAANRSYYAIFHCMRSVLAFDKVDFSKHSGVSAYFRKNYVKTRIFPSKMSDIVMDAFDIRNDSDYEDYYIISKKDVLKQIENAEIFYKEIEKYLSEKII